MIGESLGRYEILEVIGAGGMGAVYKGLDRAQQRLVALKLLPAQYASDRERVERFLREGEAGARLHHPYIVEVYEVGEERGISYIAMEYVAGVTLKEWMKEGPLPQREALRLASQIAEALEHAHGHNIVHRDLKPSNIMVEEDGKARVMDFGLARITDVSALTKTGELMGTVSYLSPEQAMGGEVDGRSDLYSLGVVLYEMLTGRLPFEGESPVSVIYKHLNEEPLPPRRLNPTIWPAVESVTLRLLKKDPEGRFPSAKEVVEAIKGCMEAGEGEALIERFLPPRVAEFHTPLVGRERELGTLEGYLERAMRGQGLTVLIGGEAGVGKTRLVEELQARAKVQNVNCLTGTCLYEEAPNPYLPFVEALEGYLDRRETVLLGRESTLQGEIDGLTSQLSGLLPFATGEAGREGPSMGWPEAQARMFEALTRLFLAISRLRPLLLFLDDLQWASVTTLQLFHYLARGIREARILVVGTYRREEVGARRGEEGHPFLETMRRMSREGLLEEMQVTGLAREDLAQMLTPLFRAGSLDEEFVDLLFQETEGNPFFVLETMRLLRDKGALLRDEEGWYLAQERPQMEIPPRVFGVIARRLEQVTAEERDLLDYAAVLGRRFGPEILVPLTGLGRLDLLKRLRVLEQRYQLIVSEDDRYRFAHHKIHEVLYHELPPALRREYHLEVARCMEELHAEALEEVIYDLAHHYLRGGGRDKALHYSLLAAHKAERLYAPQEALQFYGAALGLLEAEEEKVGDGKRRVEILRAQANLLLIVGQRKEALESLSSALRSNKDLNDPLQEAIIWTEMGNVEMRMGDWDKALALCRRGLRQMADGLQKAQTLSTMGTALFLKGDWEGSLRYYRKGLRMAERAGDEVQRAKILGNLGNLYDARGEERKAIQQYENAIAILEGANRVLEVALGYLNLGYAHASLEEWGEAERCYERSLEVFQRVGDIYHAALAFLHLAEARFAQGQLESAKEFCDKAGRLFHRLGDSLGIADAARVLGAIHKAKGEGEAGEECLHRALEAYQELDDRLNLAEASLELGMMLEERGEMEKAAPHLRRAEGLFRSLGAEEARQRVSERLAQLVAD